MKQQEIRNIYTQKVTELLNQGYILFPDTMNGHQGEIAKVDLTDGKDIIRVLLNRDHRYLSESGFWGDTICLTIGKAPSDTQLRDEWIDNTIWNNRLDTLFQIEWADLERGTHTKGGERHWYTTLEEGARCTQKRRERYRTLATDTREELGDAYKSAALKWVRKQPRMKTCRLEDIGRMYRVRRTDGRRYFEIEARGQKMTIGR